MAFIYANGKNAYQPVQNPSNGQLNLQNNSMILHVLILHTTNKDIFNILLNLFML